MDTNKHNDDLVEFFRQNSFEMMADYERIRSRSREDPGTAGDQGEENWAELLRDWLSPAYQIVTKGRILGATGIASHQIDVIVLKAAYPKRLLSKKLFLADGVAAAFECKNTLKGSHIEAAVRTGVEIKRLFPARTGTPYRELHTPIVCGLLAHSHVWKGPSSDPADNITQRLLRADEKHASHPRESLDMICVADLGEWDLNIFALLSGIATDSIRFPDGVTETTYIRRSFDVDGNGSFPTPIGNLIANLTIKLAWEDPSVRGLADYYSRASITGGGSGTRRQWQPNNVYSDLTLTKLASGLKPAIRGVWDEWSYAFIQL